MKFKIFLLILSLSIFFSLTSGVIAGHAVAVPCSFEHEEYSVLEKLNKVTNIYFEKHLDGGLEGLRNSLISNAKYKLENEVLTDEWREYYQELIIKYEKEEDEFYKQLPQIKELAKLLHDHDEKKISDKFRNVTIAVEEVPDDVARLETVRNKMREAPIIKAIWCENLLEYARWVVLDECSHKVRAAKELNMRPVIIDVSGDLSQEKISKIRNNVFFLIGFDEVIVVDRIY
ncbi:MAG: hypothetical protein FWC02_01700 [Firmicutes bacterium]|nr:hypothetical protein [Bacillota bacterium]